jgi:hypothetical protein
MTLQSSFDFSAPAPLTGSELAIAGMDQAIDHADKLQPKWSDDAFLILREFLSICDTPFMTEDLRKYAEDKRKFVAPASARAWGGIMARAKKAGLISMVGINQVKNAKAHCANAAVWQST